MSSVPSSTGNQTVPKSVSGQQNVPFVSVITSQGATHAHQNQNNQRGNFGGRISASTSPVAPNFIPEPAPAHAPLQFSFAKRSTPLKIVEPTIVDGPNFTPGSLSSISSIDDADDEDDAPVDGDDTDFDDEEGVVGQASRSFASAAPLLNALYFPTKPVAAGSAGSAPAQPYDCLLCSLSSSDALAAIEHLKEAHKLVVEDYALIADVRAYLDHYRQKLKATGSPNTLFQPTENGGLLLSSKTEEDQKLRADLQRIRLTALIEKQQEERNDRSFSRKCLFCKKLCVGDRAQLFAHMFAVHKFNVGLPDNLVHANELLDLLQQKINALQCIYCEKIFKSYSVLKLHMRKKKHFKIDARNHEYDRFYLVNYLEVGKDWKQIQEEDDEDVPEPAGSRPDDWADWIETEGDSDPAVCLFCTHQSADSAASFLHTKEVHGFDFHQLRKDHALDTYGAIKMINYIRRQVYEHRCILCGLVFPDDQDRLEHMTREKHYALRKNDQAWKDAQYLFPTYENDALLSGFAGDSAEQSEDDDDTDEGRSQMENNMRRLSIDLFDQN